MKRALPLILLLAGCSTMKQPEIREVPVPTPVACVDPSEIPPEPPRVADEFNGDARHDLEVLAPNARALRQWGQELRALLENCIAQAPGGEAALEEPDTD